MEEVVADYITANTPIAPSVLGGAAGRITLPGRRTATVPNCPNKFRLPDEPGPVAPGRRSGRRPAADGRGAPAAFGRPVRPGRGRPACDRRRTRWHHRRLRRSAAVNPGGVIVVRGDNVSTDDPVRVELVGGVTRIELGTAVTDGEGHFTIGATVPPETRRSVPTRSRSAACPACACPCPCSSKEPRLRRPERRAPGTRRRACRPRCRRCRRPHPRRQSRPSSRSPSSGTRSRPRPARGRSGLRVGGVRPVQCAGAGDQRTAARIGSTDLP